ncbi:hypothetical protein K1X76_07605 [bacterium]|nr:hypothetical protein [bacterium]
MSELINFINKKASQDEVSRYCDWLSSESRLSEIYALPAKMQEGLFSIARGNIKLTDMIPASTAPYVPVVFHGINSMPAFRKFQKVLCRTEDSTTLIGYNKQAMEWFTGPGYFIVTENSDRAGNELHFDYNQNIKKWPNGWPAYKDSNKGVSTLVYGKLHDYVRQVSSHIFIGEAMKQGKKVGYFILCREEMVRGETKAA